MDNGQSKKTLPNGIQTFSKIRQGDYYYVDKTQYLVELAKETAIFLSRPRRFGKSLTIDTLDELFSGNKVLFNGLYAEKHWDWEVTYPVIRLGFTEGEILSAEALEEEIHAQLAANEAKHQVPTGNHKRLHDRFRSLVQAIAEKRQSPVVILIDEYDKPMLDNINKAPILAIRGVLRDLYSVIKGQDKHIRFTMLTGVSKFSRVNVFSGLNSLMDITLMPQFSAICGYTQAELEDVFAPELLGVDMDKVKKWYNGYNWNGDSVYNPFDVLLFFKSKQFEPHWFRTGSSAWLVDNLVASQLDMHRFENNTYDSIRLDSFDVDKMNPVAILFQTGYLTINAMQDTVAGTRYTLKYPNVEVQQSLNRVLIERYVSQQYEIISEQSKIADCLLAGDYDGLEQLFHAFYAGIPHQWYDSTNNQLAGYEAHYASVFYGFLTGLGVRIHCEASSNQGRMDAWFDYDGVIYLIEFKVAQSADEIAEKSIQAIEQIKSKGYAEQFSAQQRQRGRPIVLLGIVFGREERNIAGFEVEIIPPQKL
ncbi:MAG: hypothetical protein CR974_01865 [Gammaproteobacteria bacterium]|nr:MAG: hypothetical protein CR974_01865 [Gammaproteobacteria bacterium]